MLVGISKDLTFGQVRLKAYTKISIRSFFIAGLGWMLSLENGKWRVENQNRSCLFGMGTAVN